MKPIRLQRAVCVILRTTVTYLISLSVSFSPIAAQAASPAVAVAAPAVASVRSQDLLTAKDMVDRPVTEQSRPGEIIVEIPTGVGSDGEAKVLPSKTGRAIMLAAAENVKLHGKMAGSAAKRSAVGLPASQAIFVATMAIAGYPMIAQSLVKDPLAWERELVDPWMATGLAGFYVLMATQGYTEAALKHHLPHKAGRYLFPATAMGVGMGMSMYVSNIMTDPNVALCAKLMFGALDIPKEMSQDQAKAELKRSRAKLFERAGIEANTDPCDRAYEHLIVHQKLWEMAPQLASVVTTSLILAYGQKQVLERLAASTLKS